MIQHIDPRHPRQADPELEAQARGPGPADAPECGAQEGDARESAFAHLCEIGESMRRLLILRADRRRLRIRKWILAGITFALVLVALIPLVIGGVDRLVTGMAQGFALLFGGRSWLGDIATGVFILGALALFVLATRSWLARKSLWKKEAHLGTPGQ
jgi:hypothetical protein